MVIGRQDLLRGVVRIVDKDGQVHGLGFFTVFNQIKYCITFLHCINKLDLIFIIDSFSEKHLCTLDYSDIEHNLAFLRCRSGVSPLNYRNSEPNEVVSVLFFDGGGSDNYPAIIDGVYIKEPVEISPIYKEATGSKKWNINVTIKGTLNRLDNISGRSHLTPNKVDGGPLLTYDGYVVGMAVKIESNFCCLPIDTVQSAAVNAKEKKELSGLAGKDEELESIHSTEESEAPGQKSAKVDSPFFTTNEFFRDNPTDIDKLGRRMIAVILSSRLRYIWNDTASQKALGTGSKAFMLNIDGPWGVGKTSLFKLLKKELSNSGLNEKFRWITIEFNAWEHQRSNPPWWYLMDQVFRQGLGQLSNISNRFPTTIKLFLRKVNIFLREHWWRLTVGRSKAIYVAIGLLLIGAILFLTLRLPGEQSNEIPKYLTGVIGSISLVLSLVTAIYGIKNSLFPSTGDAVRNFIKGNNDPSYHISKHFDFLIDKLKQPVLIFIDDLDRCNENYVVEFIEGIQTLFRRPNVIFIVAADQRWIYTSFAKEYESFSTVNEPGRSVGFLFLEKIFQLSVTIPKLSKSYKDAYLKDLLQSEFIKSDEELRRTAHQEVQNLNTEQILDLVNKPLDPVLDPYIREQAVIKLEEKESVSYTEHWLQKFSHLMEGNPRAMKRLLNTFTLYRAFLIILMDWIDFTDLVIWTILRLRWPELTEFFERQPRMIDYIGTSDKNSLKEVPNDLQYLFTDKNVIDVVNAANVGSRLSTEKLRKLIDAE